MASAAKAQAETSKPVGHNGVAYVTNFNDDTVQVIETATNSIVATIPVGDQPYGVAVSPDGGQVYVTKRSSNTVSVLNVPTAPLPTKPSIA